MRAVLDDLEAEQAELDGLVAPLDEASWGLPTPADPWTIRDQIVHLAHFDEKAALAASDPEAFADDVNRELGGGLEAFMAGHLARGHGRSGAEILEWWRTARSSAAKALAECDPDRRLPWYGPPMRAESAAVARLMETWAHGQDVADALGVVRTPTERLFRVAGLGVKTFRFSFENRGLAVPDRRVRVALRGPTGRMRVWNDESDESVTGPVEEFCLVVAQRRALEDTHLVVEGATAGRWMEIAQVFAGPPGPGRAPARGADG